MVGKLDRDRHILQHTNRTTTEVIRIPACDVVKVAGLVDRNHAVGGDRLTQEIKLDLRVDHDAETRIRGPLDSAFENASRIGRRGPPVGHEDIAEHARDGVIVGTPREQLERRGIRLEEHVRLVDARQALNRRAVEANALGEGFFKLARVDRN